MNDQKIAALFSAMNLVLDSVELFARGNMSQLELQNAMKVARSGLKDANQAWEDAAQPGDTEG